MTTFFFFSNFRWTRYSRKLHSQTKHFSSNGDEPQSGERITDIQLRSSFGLLSEKLLHTQFGWSAYSARVHETTSALHQLPSKIGCDFRWCGRGLRWPRLPDVSSLLHGRSDICCLFLPQIIPHSRLERRRNAEVRYASFFTPFFIIW